jgi:hypothetical protein
MLFVPFLLGASKSPEPKIEHMETMYKDLTGDGVEEKLVFAYSGPLLELLDVSFRIYQIDPETKAEKEVFSQKWNTWTIYNDVHGPDYSIDKVKWYITNFFGRMCFDSSKNKRCQAKCLGSLWCREGEIKRSIAMTLMGQEEYRRWQQWRKSNITIVWKTINEKSKDPNFDKTSIWEEFDRVLLSSMPVDKKKLSRFSRRYLWRMTSLVLAIGPIQNIWKC